MAAGELLLEPAREPSSRLRALPPRTATPGRAAELGPDAGMIGAAIDGPRGARPRPGRRLMAGRLTVCPTPIGNMATSPRGCARRSRTPTSSPARTRAAPAASTSGSRSSRRASSPTTTPTRRSRAPQLAKAIERGARGRAAQRRRHAGALRPRLPADQDLHRARHRDRGAAGPVGDHDGARRLRAARRPLALRGLPAAPRRRARARAAVDRDGRRLRVAAPAARLPARARRARARSSRGGLPRADEAPRGGRPRHRSASSRRHFRADVKGEIVVVIAPASKRARRPTPPSPSTPCAASCSRERARGRRPASSRR